MTTYAGIVRQRWGTEDPAGDYMRDRDWYDQQKRRVGCLRCGKRSRLVSGPVGREWFREHECA